MSPKITDYLLYASVLFLPSYLVRFSFFGLPTNLLEMLVIFAVLFWMIDLKKSSVIFALPKIYWLSFLLIFLGLVLSSFLNPHWAREAGIIKGWFVLPFLFFLVLLDRLKNNADAEKILRLLYVSSASVGLLGVLYLFLDITTFDGRLRAFYLSPNHLAMFLAPGIIIGFFSIKTPFHIFPLLDKEKIRKRSLIIQLFLLSSLLILLIALYFTFSYGAWIAIFFSLTTTLLLAKFPAKSPKIKLFFALIFLFLIAFSFQIASPKFAGITGSDPRSSSASRMMIWKSAWKIGGDNPVWGIGPGNFQDHYLEYQKYFPPYLEWAVPQPHNLYLAFWMQTGALGIVGFILLVWYWIVGQIKFIRRQKNSLHAAVSFAIILYFLLHGLIDTPYWKNDLAFLFWIILALGLFFSRQAQPIQMLVDPIDKK